MKKETHTHFTWSHIHYVHGGKAQIKYIQLQKFHSFVGDSNAWLCFSIIVIICFIFSLGASVYWALSFPCPGYLTWISPSILPALLS